MTTALDSNIISGLLVQGAESHRVLAQLSRCREEGLLLISPVVYAEVLACPNATPAFINSFLEDTGIRSHFEMSQAVWSLAGERYARYAARRRQAMQEGPRRMKADFLIGAHALTHADRLMTPDTTVYQQDFPELRLYPEPSA